MSSFAAFFIEKNWEYTFKHKIDQVLPGREIHLHFRPLSAILLSGNEVSHGSVIFTKTAYDG